MPSTRCWPMSVSSAFRLWRQLTNEPGDFARIGNEDARFVGGSSPSLLALAQHVNESEASDCDGRNTSCRPAPQ